MSHSSEIIHTENIPTEGFLLLANRLDFHEVLQLEKLLRDRRLIWLCEQSCAHELDPQITNHLDRSNIEAIGFDHNDTDGAIDFAAELRSKIDEGAILIYVTGSAHTNSGTHFHIPGKTLNYLTGLMLPTLPLCVNIPNETSLPQDSQSLAKSILSFGKCIPAADISTASWQQAIYNLNESVFSNRDLLNLSLPYALLLGLKKFGARRSIHDGTDDSELGFDKLLGAAIAFSKEIKLATNKPRVGIILPPGKGGMLANLAVLFAGKTPVNLNFTASKTAVESSIRQADLDKFITADPFVRKVSSFPWPPNRDLIYIERTLPRIKKQIVRWVILSKFIPASILAWHLGLKQKGGNDEAVLLFTSGSSGEPKGVPLSHRNVMANVCQFSSRLQLTRQASVLGCLPLFHSFGCTVTLWYPILEGLNLVTFPSPLDTKRLAQLIEKHKIDLLLSTPTFLRGFMRKIKPEQLSSIRLCVTGAEKLPESIARAFEKKFGILPQEGYGLTETSPATNVNLPDADHLPRGVTVSSSRFGSVGQFLQGMSVKITTIDDDKPQPLDQSGMIWLKGPNVFNGYLNNKEKTDEVIIDGWFKTGDVGRVDEDGFLYIEGRISRFSKIGGEMVPHEAVENAITKALNLTDADERKIAVVGIPDEQKGEAIALLSTIHEATFEQECLALRYELMDQGVPSLWCPKVILPCSEVPVLASGKLDIKGCEALVNELTEK